MKVFIRADAGVEVGYGHVMRCLALAEELEDRGAAVWFISRRMEGGLVEVTRSAGFPVEALLAFNGPFDSDGDAADTREIIEKHGGADWVVADRYGLDRAWDETIRATGAKLLVVDDLAQNDRTPDILLNQNHLPGIGERYDRTAPKDCIRLLGARYALLRRRLREARRGAKPRARVNNILIMFGGADTTGATLRSLEALAPLTAEGLTVTAVTGPNNPDIGRIEQLAAKRPAINILRFAEDVLPLTMEADLAVGAFGVSIWERLLLGVPSLIVTIADIQELPARALADDGYAVYLGAEDVVTSGLIRESVEKYLRDPDALAALSRKGMELVDGEGAARVADAMIAV